MFKFTINVIIIVYLCVLVSKAEASILPRTNILFKVLKDASNCDFTISSGHRSKKHNKRVGGAKNSFHLTGQALDLVPKCNKPFSYIARQAIKAGFSGVIVYKKHIHVDIGIRKYYKLN